MNIKVTTSIVKHHQIFLDSFEDMRDLIHSYGTHLITKKIGEENQ